MLSLKVALILFCFVKIEFSEAQSCSTQAESDISAEDLASVPGQLADCCGICSSHPGCRAYAWNNYEGGTCWLKSTTSPIIGSPGVTVGLLDEGGGDLVNFDEFRTATTMNGYPEPTLDQFNAFAASLGPKGMITTKQEAAMALTQFMWESDGLRAKREYRCENNGCPGEYETPGCDIDGQDYYGRGYIQLSWCYNYGPASLDLFGDQSVLVYDPDRVAREESTAWDTAFWFWKVNVHFAPGVQEGKFGATTRAINGGLECDGPNQDIARHRYEMYKVVRQALSLPGDGDETGCYN